MTIAHNDNAGPRDLLHCLDGKVQIFSDLVTETLNIA